ncbi:MAG: hypothetical protein WDO68_08100 [Gammaproteobacteria bacterium]
MTIAWFVQAFEQEALENPEARFGRASSEQPLAEQARGGPPHVSRIHAEIPRFPDREREKGKRAAGPESNADEAQRARRVDHEGLAARPGDDVRFVALVQAQDQVDAARGEHPLRGVGLRVTFGQPEEIHEAGRRGAGDAAKERHPKRLTAGVVRTPAWHY